MGCIDLVRCMLVLLCIVTMVVWYPYAGWSPHPDTTPPQPNHNVTPTHIEPDQYNSWNNSTNKSQAPEDVRINIRNMLTLNNEIIKQVTSSWSLFIQLTVLYFPDILTNRTQINIFCLHFYNYSLNLIKPRNVLCRYDIHFAAWVQFLTCASGFPFNLMFPHNSSS